MRSRSRRFFTVARFTPCSCPRPRRRPLSFGTQFDRSARKGRRYSPMILPVQVTFRQMDPYPEAERWVRDEAAKLDEFYSKITSCRVAIEATTRRRRSGNPYQVRVDLTVPG